MKKRVFIVDDHPIMRYGLRQLIETGDDFEVCGEAGTSREALTCLESLHETPDLAIIDISLPDRGGLDLIKDLRALFASMTLLVVSMHDEGLYAERVLRAGARGYVMKEEAPGLLKKAIRTVLSGGVFLSEGMSAKIVQRLAKGEPQGSNDPVERLTDRELEVFRLIGSGKGTREIAGQLGVSIRTIDAHRAHIKTKLEIKDGTELMHRAVRWVEAGHH